MAGEIISLRKFAERLQIGEKTIRDGIKTGKIIKGVKLIDGKPKIDYQVALEEAKAAGLGNKILKYKPDKPEQKPNNDEQPPKKQDLLDLNIGSHSTLPLHQALQAKENYNARIKALEYKKLDGSLADKKEMYVQLFDFHRELRNSLLIIPDRITDTILSFGNDRKKVNQYIYEAIATELEKLSNTVAKEI